MRQLALLERSVAMEEPVRISSVTQITVVHATTK